MDVHGPKRKSPTDGFSLVGLLMVVVVLGALTATAIIGVSSLTGSSSNLATATLSTTPRKVGATGSSGATAGIGTGNGIAQSACTASADAARSASTSYFVTSGGAYPVKWSDVTTSNPPIYQLPANVVVNGGNPTELDGRGWKLVMSGGGTTEPTFTCSLVASAP